MQTYTKQNIRALKRYLQKRIKRNREMAESSKLNKYASEYKTVWGGWESGYWQGKLSAYEDIYDFLFNEEGDVE